MFKIQVSTGRLPDTVLSKLDAAEADGAGAMSERDDTSSLWIMGPTGLIGYAVFGRDEGGMVAVYYARAVAGFGRPLMKQFFGVAQVLGSPLRLHVSSIKEIAVKARLVGAEVAIQGEDAEGNLTGIFK